MGEVTSMVERVARAIETGDGHDPNEEVFTPDGFQKRYILALPAARAAIEAMRTPSVFMLRSADNAIISDERLESGPFESDKFTWETMIDAALNEQVSG